MRGSGRPEGGLLSNSGSLQYSNSALGVSDLSQGITNPLQLLNMTSSVPMMSGLGGEPTLGQQVVSQSLVGSTPPHGFRKVLVKPIAPKQNLPTGIQTVGSVTGFGQVPHTSLPTNSLQTGAQSLLSQQPTIQSPLTSPVSSLSHLANFPILNAPPISSPPHGYHVRDQSSHLKMIAPVSVPPLNQNSMNIKTTSIRSRSQSRSGPVSSSNSSPGSSSANKPRKPCNCKNSQCLKLYCDCFANGEFCRDSCNCQNCKNSLQYEEERARAVKACLERNPNAFKPKVGHVRTGDERRHIKGCNCKKSSCLKNYCECYEAKIPCSHLCRCVSCQNLPDRPEGKGLMELANAADLRTQQQRAASSHFLEQIETPFYNHVPLEGQKLPYSFVNKDVTRATSLCLLEEASHAASSGQSSMEVERAVLIEFGRCLEQIINSSETANQSLRESVTGTV